MKLLYFLTALLLHPIIRAQSHPNFLLIIADDLGVDMLNGFGYSGLKPNTPTLDSLRNVGLTFSNAWAYPTCTPTRASIMSLKFGNKTDVLQAPGHLDTSETSIFKYLKNQDNYSCAAIGKWHVADPAYENHPMEHGLDYYTGVLGAQWNAYDNWLKTENGITDTCYDYATSLFTDRAISWINQQNQPWICWLAHMAPHSPFHLPPDSMYTLQAVGTNFRMYVAMIESLDFEINRLLKNIPDSILENTTLIFVGDNGTPTNFIQDYPPGHGKNTLYEGGVKVPLIFSGFGVSRSGEVEKRPVHLTDIGATLLDLSGAQLPGGKHNSYSLFNLLNNSGAPSKKYNFSEVSSDQFDGWIIRNNQYKLLQHQNGAQEFYKIDSDSLEYEDLMLNGLTSFQQLTLDSLHAEGMQIINSWSCNDKIQNGDETGIDCGGTYCAPCGTGFANHPEQKIKIIHNHKTNTIYIELRKEEILQLELYDLNGRSLSYNSNYFDNGIRLKYLNPAPQILLLKVVTNENMISFPIFGN